MEDPRKPASSHGNLYLNSKSPAPSCDVSLTGSSGEFSSPGYDQGDEYTNNLQCDYSVTVAEGQTVQITFQSPFNVESCNGQCCDAVKVRDVCSVVSLLNDMSFILVPKNTSCPSHVDTVITVRTRLDQTSKQIFLNFEK